MSIRYLMDENLDPLYKRQLLIKKPNLVVYAVGDPGSPLNGMIYIKIGGVAYAEQRHTSRYHNIEAELQS